MIERQRTPDPHGQVQVGRMLSAQQAPYRMPECANAVSDDGKDTIGTRFLVARNERLWPMARFSNPTIAQLPPACRVSRKLLSSFLSGARCV